MSTVYKVRDKHKQTIISIYTIKKKYIRNYIININKNNKIEKYQMKTVKRPSYLILIYLVYRIV